MSRKRKTGRDPEPAPAAVQGAVPNRRLWAICAGILFCVWAALYWPHLRTSPRWYGDEFVTLIGGNAIWNGTFANRALRYDYFSVFTCYQPAGLFLYSAASHIFTGGDILGARMLAIFLGFLTALAAFHLLFLRGLVAEGVAAAIIILAAPESVIHFRWVYPHYFVSLGVVVIGLMLDQPRTPRRDWIIGLGCACAGLGHLLVAHVTLAALLVRWRYPGAWWRIIIPPAVVMLLSLAFGYIIAGNQLFPDLWEVAMQYTGHNTNNTLATRAYSFWIFFTWDWLHVLYVVGLVLLVVQRRWAMAAYAALLSFFILQNRPELPIFYYQAMIFTPLLAVCVACGLQPIFRWLVQRDPKLLPDVRSRTIGAGVLAAIVPCFLMVTAIPSSFSGDIVSRNNRWVAPSDHDLEVTAQWVNEHTGKDDFVVTFWDLGWMLKCRWTDTMQCAVWQYGTCFDFYQRTRDHSEFLFPADISQARYVVVGPLDLRWAYAQGTVPRLIQESGLRSWPKVAGTETTFVLENPRFLNQAPPP